jgi:hypothetical protein
VGTEVWCEAPEERRYRVRDLWTWHRDFERFRSRFQAEYERFGSWVLSEGVVEKEEFLGAYYERASGEEDSSVSV